MWHKSFHVFESKWKNVFLRQKRLEEKLSLPPMIFAIEKATAILIFKQRQKLHRLLTTKELTALPRGKDREALLSTIIGRK